jgi:hypothetical protein
MLDALKIFKKNRSAVSGAVNALEDLRSQIDRTKRDIAATARAPRPVGDALAAFDAWADAAATAAVDRTGLERLVQPGNSGALRLPIVRLPGEAAPDLTEAVEILLGLLVLTSRDKLRDVIAGQVGDLVQGNETLSSAERAVRIESLQSEMRQLEFAEEKIVRELESAGLPVARRADAPALALLAADAALPG